MADNGATPDPQLQPQQAVSQILVNASNVAARILPHPELEGGILDIVFEFGAGSLCTVRVPAAAWPAVRDTIDALMANAPDALAAAQQAARAAQSGLVLPGDMNIDEAARAKAEAERRLRGGPST